MDSSAMQGTRGWVPITWRAPPLFVAAVLALAAHTNVRAADVGDVAPTLKAIEQSAEVIKPPIPPSKAELADSAFKKLDVGAKGYVTRDEIREIDGFDTVFDSVDVDRTGRLNEAEFKKAWAIYSGNKP